MSTTGSASRPMARLQIGPQIEMGPFAASQPKHRPRMAPVITTDAYAEDLKGECVAKQAGPERRTTLSADRISFRSKLGYSLGLTAANTSAAAIGVLINPIFNITMGLSPAIISTTLFLQRFWNATFDPVAGQLSDNFRSRWGRRRPLIIAACVPLGIAFAAIWFFPRSLSAGGLLAYLLGTSLLFYSIHSIYSVPLTALGMEETNDYHERTRFNVFAQICSFVVLIAIQWAFPFIQLKCFKSPVDGARCFAVVFGLALAALASAPFFMNREKLYQNVRQQERKPLWTNIKTVLNNQPFMMVVGARAVYSFSYNLVSVLGLYINYYYIYRGDIKRAAVMQSWNGTIFQISAIAALFFLRWFAIRFGKRETMMLALLVQGFGCLAKLFVYRPEMPWLQVIVYVTNGIAAAGMIMPVDAMLPDIADYDEERSGMRREGAYASVLVWFDRAGNSLGSLLSGFILVWIGFDVHLGGAQSPYALNAMRYAYCGVPLLGVCLAFMLVCRYSLTEKSCYSTKAELEFRRAAQGQTAA